MQILIFGSDSGAHALAWKLVNSNYVEEVILAPGNGGTSFFAPAAPLPPEDLGGLTSFVLAEGVDLVVADAAAIAAGVADEIGSLPLPVFGANKALDRLQTSRCAAREWLQQHGLPLPRGRVCTSRVQAEKYAATIAPPLVIAADEPDGAVVICTDRTSVPLAIDECLDMRTGGGVIVEELVSGPLVTASILTDGSTAVPIPATRVYPGEARPYAHGTGVHAAATPLWHKLESFLTQQVRDPLLAALKAEGGARGWIGTTCVVGQRGPLVQGLHLVPSGLEAVATLLRLDGDLLPLLIGCARGTLAAAQPPRWRDEAVVGVALCRPGAQTGPASLPAFDAFEPGVLVFHHATTPALPNPYVPRAARYGGAKPPKLGLGGTPSSLSTATAAAPLIAIVAAAAPSLAAARERVYTNLRRAGPMGVAYREDVGGREL